MRVVDRTPRTTALRAVNRPRLSAHIQIARPDHWVKNVFVLPGIVVALSIDPAGISPALGVRLLIGLVAICLVTSSNYVINELLDAPSDAAHPIKSLRPVPSGLVHIPFAYLQWLALMAAGVGLSLSVSYPFAAAMLALWVMGCIYNIPPLRAKDVPYLDVLTEAINNPLRMLAGWYVTGTVALPPTSMLISYWMIGCYFMAIKRFAEYREIGNAERSAAYRKSFAFYTEQRLLVSIMFYGSVAMLFFGAFIVRYRLELILAFPLVALVMSTYLSLAFKPDSVVQRPEGLHAEPLLMTAVVVCTVVMLSLLFVDVNILHHTFAPTVSTR